MKLMYLGIGGFVAFFTCIAFIKFLIQLPYSRNAEAIKAWALLLGTPIVFFLSMVLWPLAIIFIIYVISNDHK